MNGICALCVNSRLLQFFFFKTLLVKQHTCLFRGHGLGMMTVTLLHCPFYKLPDSLSYIYTIGKIHRVLTQKNPTPHSATHSRHYLQCIYNAEQAIDWPTSISLLSLFFTLFLPRRRTDA